MLIKNGDVCALIIDMAPEDETLRMTIATILGDIQDMNNATDIAASWDSLCGVMPGEHFQRNFVFKVMYPRLDERVTTEMNHCAKAPFVVHPATKRASVPIPDIDTWKPEMAPRLSQLVELDDKTAGVYGWQWKKQRDTEGAVMGNYVRHTLSMLREAYPHEHYRKLPSILSSSSIK